MTDDNRVELWRVETCRGVETIRVWPSRVHQHDTWNASHPRYGTVDIRRSPHDAAQGLVYVAQVHAPVLAPGAPTRDELTAKLRAAEAERDGALAHAETLTQALRATQRERDALRDIIEGRATPPTDSDIAVHVARGGLWRTRRTIGDTMLSRDGVDADRAERVRDEQARTGGVYLWWALDAHGRPCAWPGGGQ